MMKNIGFLTAANTVVNILASMVVGVLISRGLPVEQRGVVFLVFQAALISSVFLTFGMSQSIVFSQKDSADSVGRSFLLSLTVFILLTVLLVTNKSKIPLLVDQIFGLHLAEKSSSLFLFSTMSMVLFSILTSKVQTGEHGIQRSLQISIFGNIIYLCLFYFFFFIHGLSVEKCIIIFLVSYIVRCLLSLVFSRPIFSFDINVNLNGLIKFGKESFLFWINVVFFIVFSKINMLIAGRYISSQEFGIYSVSLTVIEIVGILPSAIGTVLFPYMVKSGFSESDNRLQDISRLMFEIATLAAVCVLIFGYWIITTLYGNAYSSAFIPLLVMLPGSVFLSVVFAFTNYLNSTGKTVSSNYVYVMCILLTCLVSIPIVKSYGMIGASISYTFGCFVTYVFFLFVCNKGFKRGFRYLVSVEHGSVIYNTIAQKFRN